MHPLAVAHVHKVSGPVRVHAPKAARRQDENGAGKPRDLAVLDHGFMAHAESGLASRPSPEASVGLRSATSGCRVSCTSSTSTAGHGRVTARAAACRPPPRRAPSTSTGTCLGRGALVDGGL